MAISAATADTKSAGLSATINDWRSPELENRRPPYFYELQQWIVIAVQIEYCQWLIDSTDYICLEEGKEFMHRAVTAGQQHTYIHQTLYGAYTLIQIDGFYHFIALVTLSVLENIQALLSIFFATLEILGENAYYFPLSLAHPLEQRSHTPYFGSAIHHLYAVFGKKAAGFTGAFTNSGPLPGREPR